MMMMMTATVIMLTVIVRLETDDTDLIPAARLAVVVLVLLIGMTSPKKPKALLFCV